MDGTKERDLAAYLRLVEAEVLRAGDGGLGGRGQVLPRLAPGLYLRIDALQHLQWFQPCQVRLNNQSIKSV